MPRAVLKTLSSGWQFWALAELEAISVLSSANFDWFDFCLITKVSRAFTESSSNLLDAGSWYQSRTARLLLGPTLRLQADGKNSRKPRGFTVSLKVFFMFSVLEKNLENTQRRSSSFDRKYEVCNKLSELSCNLRMIVSLNPGIIRESLIEILLYHPLADH